MKIPDSVKNCLNSAKGQRRLIFATASPNGVPNAVPIGLLWFNDDETIILMDNYFLKTKANLEKNPRAALTCWEMEEKDGKPALKDGFQLKGSIKTESSGSLYEKIKADAKAINPNYPARAIVLFKVEEIYYVKGGPTAGKPFQA